MNNDLKSLAKIAEELNITRQAVYKRVNGSPEIQEQLKPHTVNNGSRVYYTTQGQEIIKRLFVFKYQAATNDNQCKANVNQCEAEETTGNSTNGNSECDTMESNDNPNCNQCKPTDSQCKPTGTDPQSGAGSLGTADADAFKAAIEALTAQLNTKDEQLRATQSNVQELNKRIEELTNALTCSQEQQRALTEALTAAQHSITAAQALHAGTLQERLTGNEEPEPEAVTVPPNKEHSEGEPPRGEDPAEEPAPKKSLFARLFKRK